MVTGWRRAFCTSIPKEREPKIATEKPPSSHTITPITTPTNTTTATATSYRSPRFGSKFNFFSSSSTTTTTPAGSNSSTPRLQTPPVSSPSLRCRTTTSVPTSATTSPLQDSNTPKLQCKTGKSPRFFHRNSNPSSPRSPSTFSLIKNSLRISKPRCGICIQTIKTGQGTAIFTAECSHTFHFPCIASHVGKNRGLICPVCGSNWNELPLLAVQNYAKSGENNKSTFSAMKISDLKVYNDDESLMSPNTGARFNPIPESDEHDEENTEEFQGFFVNNPTMGAATPPRSNRSLINHKDIEVRISPDAAVVAVGRSYETYAVVVKITAPPPPSNLSNRLPVDLVAVIDVGGGITFSRLQMIKRTMRLIISSLSSIDRLSIVAFSANSKRLLPFRKMTTTGRRSARRITDALICSQGSCVNDALRKASKVIQDRREKNPGASIILISDGPDEKGCGNQRSHGFSFVSSTRYSPLEIPVHWLNIGAYESSYGGENVSEDGLSKCIGGLLSLVVSDLRLRIGFSTGSGVAEISGVYSCSGRPGLLRASSAKLGDMYAGEEKEILLELKAPLSTTTVTNHILTVRSSYKDPTTQDQINGKEHALIVPRPHTIRSSEPSIQRLRSLFVVTRAVAESRRLIDRKDFNGANHLLSSAKALLMQRNGDGSGDGYLRGIEAEIAELHWRKQIQMEQQQQDQGRRMREKEMSFVDEKGQPLTPTSAWKAAEKLAKVAVMRKSMNRVSDLHGFENARF